MCTIHLHRDVARAVSVRGFGHRGNVQVVTIVSDQEDEKGVSGGRLEARYANHFRVGHNAFEFIIEFGQFYEGNHEAHVHSRLVTSPVYAKELHMILGDSIQNYEIDFGPIKDDD